MFVLLIVAFGYAVGIFLVLLTLWAIVASVLSWLSDLCENFFPAASDISNISKDQGAPKGIFASPPTGLPKRS